MNHIRAWVCFAIVCVFLTLGRTQSVEAENSRQVAPECVDVETLPVEVPEDFPGVLFSSAASDVQGNFDLVLLTHSGVQSVPIPSPLSAHMQASELTIQSVSPDGRLVSFRPVIYRQKFPEPTPLPDTPFYIWDLQTNEVGVIPLTDQDLELFIGRRQDLQGFARWADSSNLILHYITENLEEGIQRITRSVEISTDQLAITLGALTTVVKPESLLSSTAQWH